MAHEYFKAVRACSKFKGGPRELLLHLAFRASPGGRSKKGAKLPPEGWCQVSQPMLMKDMNIKRVKSIYDWLQELVDGGVLTLKPTGSRNWHILDLKALQALAYKQSDYKKHKSASETGRKAPTHDLAITAHSTGASVGEKRPTIMPLQDLSLDASSQPDTEEEQQTGAGVMESAHHIVASMSASKPFGQVDGDEDEDVEGESIHSITTLEIPDWYHEVIRNACRLKRLWIRSFITPVNAEDFYQLIQERGHTYDEVAKTIVDLRVLTGWQKRVNSSGDFLFLYDKIHAAAEKYKLRVSESGTEAHAEEWRDIIGGDIIKQFPTAASRREAFFKYSEDELKVMVRWFVPISWPWHFYYTADTSNKIEECGCLVLHYEDPRNSRIPQADAEIEARHQREQELWKREQELWERYFQRAGANEAER